MMRLRRFWGNLIVALTDKAETSSTQTSTCCLWPLLSLPSPPTPTIFSFSLSLPCWRRPSFNIAHLGKARNESQPEQIQHKWLKFCTHVPLLDCQMQRPLGVGGGGTKAKLTYCSRPFLGRYLGPQLPWVRLLLAGLWTLTQLFCALLNWIHLAQTVCCSSWIHSVFKKGMTSSVI